MHGRSGAARNPFGRMINITPHDLSHPDWNSMHFLYNEYTGGGADPELGIDRVIRRRAFRSFFVSTFPTCSRGVNLFSNPNVPRIDYIRHREHCGL